MYLINKKTIFFIGLTLAVSITLASSTVAAQSSETDDNSANQPLQKITAEYLETVHKGEATFFKTNGKGACLLGKSPAPQMLAAVDKENFSNAKLCDAYLNVKGSKGEVVVKVVDLCPGCKTGDIDLSTEAFAEIATKSEGRVNISWQIVSPNLKEPIAYFLKSANSKNIGLVQVRNHRNLIAKLEFLNEAEEWIEIPRVDNNYFEYYSGLGAGPFTFRVTDIHGNALIDKNITYTQGKLINGQKQFPAALTNAVEPK